VDLHELGEPRVQHVDLACSRFGVLAVDNLLYILVAAPAGGITFWGWLFVALGLLSDIASHAQTYVGGGIPRASFGDAA
jgi:hypothetical protein